MRMHYGKFIKPGQRKRPETTEHVYNRFKLGTKDQKKEQGDIDFRLKTSSRVRKEDWFITLFRNKCMHTSDLIHRYTVFVPKISIKRMFLPKTCFLDLKTKTQLYHWFNVSVILLMLISWARRLPFQASRAGGVFETAAGSAKRDGSFKNHPLYTLCLNNRCMELENTHFFSEGKLFFTRHCSVRYIYIYTYIYLCLPVSSIQRLICWVFFLGGDWGMNCSDSISN